MTRVCFAGLDLFDIKLDRNVIRKENDYKRCDVRRRVCVI